MTRPSRLGMDAVFAIGFAVAGAIVMMSSWRAGFGMLSQPDAGLFPFFSGLMMVVGAALVVLRAVASPAPEAEGEEIPAGARLIALIAVICAWILILPVTGFVLATFLVALVFSKMLGLAGWVRPTGLALAAAVSVYVLFQRLLFIDLPTGLLG